MMDYSNPYSLQGKTILVTGGAGGIGSAVASTCIHLGGKGGSHGYPRGCPCHNNGLFTGIICRNAKPLFYGRLEQMRISWLHWWISVLLWTVWYAMLV
jgi:hypothetical protein